jgi:hypothetical protein
LGASRIRTEGTEGKSDGRARAREEGRTAGRQEGRKYEMDVSGRERALDVRERRGREADGIRLSSGSDND